MSGRKPRTLVLHGDGVNCEQETAEAFRLVGFEAEIRHLNDLIAERMSLDELSRRYSVLALPGGFSYGDDLTSGKVLALKIRHRLGWNLGAFAERGGLVLGVCNGFQALIRMEVFGKDISITQNAQGKFVDTWIKATPSGTRCAWLRGVGTLELPIRHGEGRVVFAPTRKTELLGKMERQGMTCLRYEGDPNGSEEGLAGLCDPTGRIFGLMPHPEAFVRWTAHPEWTSQPGRASAPGQGLALFENAFKEASHVLG
ncbi:MAG: phosphoribosylformylglycinamidine synthase subunit PurQ [Oligoflexia bacterium]|nr:phosphoribosylformylglycinamidine synthase subunit PurQ [Oligoflexia bacterium]